MLEGPNVRLIVGPNTYVNIVNGKRDMSVLVPSAKDARVGLVNAAQRLRIKAKRCLLDARFIEAAAQTIEDKP